MKSNNILVPSGLNENQQACVEALEEALELAREGQIETIGIVACLPGGVAPVMGGNRAGDLALGCLKLLRMIDEATSGPEKAAARGPKRSIIQVR
jgi:hypothetical protein